MARRGNAIPTLAAALKALADWKVDAEVPDKEGYAVNYEIEYIWFDPDGCERKCAEDELVQRGSGEGPNPGRYEIRVISLDDNSMLMCWEAEHVTMQSLARSPAESPMALMKEMCYTAETQIRNTQFRLREAEKDAEKYRDQLVATRDANAKLQREIAAAITAKERAIAEKDIAEARQKDLQAAYDELEENVSVWKPQVQMAVDHAMDRLGQMLFGLPAKGVNDAQGVSEDRSQWDPPPDDLVEPERLNEEIVAMFFTLEKLQILVESGVISWQMASSFIWHKTKVNAGPVPKWEQWYSERDAAAQEPQAAE